LTINPSSGERAEKDDFADTRTEAFYEENCKTCTGNIQNMLHAKKLWIGEEKLRDPADISL